MCNQFWLFLIELTDVDNYGYAKDYKAELLSTWKNYAKVRCLIELDIISFDWNIERTFYNHKGVNPKSNIIKRVPDLVMAINTNNYEVEKG